MFHATTHRTPYDSVMSKRTSLLSFTGCFKHRHNLELAHLHIYPFPIHKFHTTTHRTLYDSALSKWTSLLHSQLPFVSTTPFPNPIHTFHTTTHRTLYDFVLSKRTSLLYPQLPFDFVSPTLFLIHVLHNHTQNTMILCCHSELAYFTLNYPLCQPLHFLSTFHTHNATWLAYFTLNYPLCQPLRFLSTFHTTRFCVVKANYPT